VFVDLAPPGYKGTGTKVDSFDLAWRSVLDGEPMSIQLIAGKTFCKNRGDEEGALAMKQLKVGQLILVEGKTNVGNRESLGHWVDKRSLDIVIFDCRVLEEAGLSTDPITEQRAKRQVPTAAPILSPQKTATQQSPTKLQEDCLKLAQVLSNAATVKVVDSQDGLADFVQQIDVLSKGIGGDKAPILTGLDCEWKPNFLLTSPTEPQPVLLLQISLNTLAAVYLFDLQALLRPCQDPLGDLNELETLTSEALSKLFGSSHFLKTGFQLMNDLHKLAVSYPHVPAFQSIHGVTEVSTIAKKAIQLGRIRNAKQLTSSLSRLTKFLLQKPVDKEQQISDWSQRPLSNEQMEYAALDAAVVPVLLEKALELVDAKWMVGDEARIGRHEDDQSFVRAISSIRFFIQENNDSSSMRKLKAKKLVSNYWMVTQSWVAGQEAPSPPSAPTGEDDAYVDIAGTHRVPARKLTIGNGSSTSEVVTRMVGKRVGKSKDACLEALASQLPDGAKLEYDHRSGMVEFEDSLALFVNTPARAGEPTRGRYPNVWLEDGKFMTFFLRKSEWNDGLSELAEKLSRNGQDSNLPSILFVRIRRGFFICCGRCRVSPKDDDSIDDRDWGLEELKLELLDWEMLQNSSDFTSMASASSKIKEEETSDEEDSGATALSMQKLARMVLDGDLEQARSLAEGVLSQKPV